MKLLDRTVRALLSYAIIILIISIPVFYFIIEKLYFEDVDDALLYKKAELQIRTKRLHDQQSIKLWLAMDGEVSIKQSSVLQKDTIYPKLYLDTLVNEMEPYRELKTSLVINENNYLVTIRRSLVESQDLIVGIAEAQAILLILLFGGWILINRRISKSLWKPFFEIIQYLQQYEIDKKPLPAPPPAGITEFDLLNIVLNELVNKNHLLFINQKNFIENASHEMQTPLAILQSKLDLLLTTEGLTEEQSTYLQSCYETIERLNHLNKSLLLLSQIENQQFAETDTINLTALIQKVLDQVDEAGRNKGLNINLILNQDKLLEGNKTLLEILISNLLTNAVHHTPAGGNIIIYLDDRSFRIENSGLPLPFDQEKLFSRFPKKNGTRYGVGLGLAIVKEISELHHIRIDYDYKDKHRFTLNF
jgi:signal transduction histidine kinase